MTDRPKRIIAIEATKENATAKQIVLQLNSGTHIIDLGAANSQKFEPYVPVTISQRVEALEMAFINSRRMMVYEGD
ncbi:hypothetical protein IL306_015219 [Fusarium sp. DS 682]|nr:hypothetical protein IL306_015219 [Fusarium sp. DS 682]